LTTTTRSWTSPSSDIQSHLQSLPTVPVFPGRLRCHRRLDCNTRRV
jgi:hypothetical protein